MKDLATPNPLSPTASDLGSRAPSARLRGSLAVLAGLVAVVGLSLGTDGVLRATGIFPESGQPMASGLYVLATAYRTLYGVVGSHIAARLAPRHPLRYAVGLGIFGFLVSLVGALATWNNAPELGPHWYPLALVATAIPAGWLGGRLQQRRQR